jgi:hypothetical protein
MQCAEVGRRCVSAEEVLDDVCGRETDDFSMRN